MFSFLLNFDFSYDKIWIKFGYVFLLYLLLREYIEVRNIFCFIKNLLFEGMGLEILCYMFLFLCYNIVEFIKYIVFDIVGIVYFESLDVIE